MDNPICIICHKSGDGEMRTIKSKAINKLIDSSTKRRDNQYKKWADLDSAVVHKTCSDNYNREKSIAAAAAEYTKKVVEGKAKVSDAGAFDYQTLCFFCGGICDEKKHSVKVVTKNETKENIVNILNLRQATDTFHQNLSLRMNNRRGLVELQARYHPPCMTKFYNKRVSDQVGRPSSQSTIDFMDHAIKFIEKNKSDCYHSLKEIKVEFNGEIPNIQSIKNGLKKEYSDVEFLSKKTDIIIILRYKINKQTWKEWYDTQEKDPTLERERIIKMAGSIILEDICAIVSNKKEYVLPYYSDKNIYDNIPKSLTDLLDIIIRSNRDRSKKKEFDWKKKVATISHSIITSARLKSFLSPIQLGLSAMIHKQFGSRTLIDSLSNLGLCSTYDETLRFEASIIEDPDNHTVSNESFTQYIFDNDLEGNICTDLENASILESENEDEVSLPKRPRLA